ncbi:MAG: hypothetical protein SFX74_12260 [Fimbriimonadaceae bacterium]|nr:hypothetical protein [Fimbriimonadaceae bacterium]
MGQTRSWKCPECGYADMVAGGKSAGLRVTTVTIQCFDCKTLQDVVIRRHHRPPELAIYQPSCERHAKHRIALWGKYGPCPVCGTPMEPGNIIGTWD